MKELFVSVITQPSQDTAEFCQVLERLHQILVESYEHYEILVMDDSEQSLILSTQFESFMSRHDSVRYVRLVKAASSEVIVNCGLDLAIGDIVAIFNAETDPIEKIPELVDRVQESSKVLMGCPTTFGHSYLNSFVLQVRKLLFRHIFDAAVPENTSDFMIFNRTTLNSVLSFRERVTYVKAIVSILGFSIETFEYAPIKDFSRGNYLKKLVHYLELFVTTTNKPLRWVSWLALLVSTINLLYIGYVGLITLFKDHIMEGWITLSLQNSMNYFLISLALAVGFEYSWRGMSGSRKKPGYFIAEEKTSSHMVARAEGLRNIVNVSK